MAWQFAHLEHAEPSGLVEVIARDFIPGERCNNVIALRFNLGDRNKNIAWNDLIIGDFAYEPWRD